MAGREWVSAGEVGEAAYCPRALYLKKQGVEPDRRAGEAIQRGLREHERRTYQTIITSRRSYSTGDGRCFVASYAFGPDDSVTDELRQWRDRVLLPSRMGRFLVQIYYRTSPRLIRRMGHYNWFYQCARWCITMFVEKVVRNG